MSTLINGFVCASENMNFLIIFLFCNYLGVTNGDLIINSERADLVFYNKTLIKDIVFDFGKLNRTTFALNASGTLLRDFTDQKMMGTMSGDQFYHNEYRFTGQKFTIPICKAWKTNMFNIIQQCKNVGFKIDLCNIKKGFYRVTNFLVDPQYYPKVAPTGKWRINVRVFHENAGEVLAFRWYMNIEKKIGS